MINERADKNTDAGSYKTKSNHYEAPEKKKSKKLDLSIGDVVALNPNSAWSPDPKKATGLYAVVTAIKTDDTVSVEAENGSVYKLFDINQFVKVKGMKESFATDQVKTKVKTDAKKNNKAALGNLAKGLVNKSPAAKVVANRMGIKTEKEDSDYDEDYYYSEGNKVRLNPNVSESFEGDVGTIRSVVGKHIMVEVEGQGIAPILRTDIKEAVGGNDENWNAFDEPAGDDSDAASDEIVDNIVTSIAARTGLDFETVLDNCSYEDVLDAFEASGQDTDAAVEFLVDQIQNTQEGPSEDWETEPMFDDDEDFDPRGREDMPPPGYGM